MPGRFTGGLAMRIVAVGCALAFLATVAKAESSLVVADALIKYGYTYETLGSRHFCDLATVMGKGPLLVKLTAAYITDDTKPKGKDIIVAYMVEAFDVRAAKGA